jgi:allantoin racemase
MVGGPFAVVTTTPLLAASIQAAAERYGHGVDFVGTSLTDGDPAHLMDDPVLLESQMATACRRAIDAMKARAIVIGGGPLASVVLALRERFDVPMIEPIEAAIKLTILRSSSR